MQIALWIVTLLCIGLWTVAAWGASWVLGMDPSGLQDLKPLIHEIPFNEQLDQWIPGWRTVLAVAVDMTQAVVGWIGHAAPWLVWAVWAVGTGVTLLLAGLVSLAIALIRRGMRTEDAARSLGTVPR